MRRSAGGCTKRLGAAGTRGTMWKTASASPPSGGRPRLAADHTHKEPCTKTAGRGPVPFYPSPSREVSVFIYLFIYSPRDKVFLSAATYGCHQRAVTKSGQRCVPLARARSLPFLGLLSSNAHPCSLGPFFTFGATILVSPVERRINRCSSTSMPLHVRVGACLWRILVIRD